MWEAESEMTPNDLCLLVLVPYEIPSLEGARPSDSLLRNNTRQK